MYRKDRKKEFFTELAKKEGYPARSVYKLKEINEKFGIFKKGDNILDLGSAPGSWILYASKIVGNKGQVTGVDQEEIKIGKLPNVSFIKKSVFDLQESDFKEKFQSVISDLSPKTSGIKSVDSGRSLELVEKAFKTAEMFLAPGGSFVCKVFESEQINSFVNKMKKYFESVKISKPKAVFKKSKEFYLVSKGFKKA